jgi:hypothetical protein
MFAYAIDSNGKVVASSSATGRAPKITQFQEIAKPAPKRRRKVQDDDETEDEGPRYKTDSEEEEEEAPVRSRGGTRALGGKSASIEFMKSRSGRALRRIAHDPLLPDLSAPVVETSAPGIAIVSHELDFGDDEGGVTELDELLGQAISAEADSGQVDASSGQVDV